MMKKKKKKIKLIRWKQKNIIKNNKKEKEKKYKPRIIHSI